VAATVPAHPVSHQPRISRASARPAASSIRREASIIEMTCSAVL
jgi:hypothetical protein